MNQRLAGKMILITKSQEDAGESFNLLRSAGGEVIPFPAIKVIPVEDFAEFDHNVRIIEDFDYLIFTSANTVNVFSDRVKEMNIDPDYENIHVICTGTKTSEACEYRDIPVDIIPVEFSANGILKNMAEVDLKKKKVFIPCSELAGDELKIGLERLDAKVTQIPIYEVDEASAGELSRQIKLITERKPDVFAFTSPSNFRNFISIMNIDNPAEYFKNSIVAAIGPTTGKSVSSFNVNVEILPEIYTLETLAESINDYYCSPGRKER